MDLKKRKGDNMMEKIMEVNKVGSSFLLLQLSQLTKMEGANNG